MKYWIIEHPTRGVFIEWNDNTDQPRFSWSCYYTDEKVHGFWSMRQAQQEMGKWNTRLAQRCVLLIVENGHVIVPKNSRPTMERK